MFEIIDNGNIDTLVDYMLHTPDWLDEKCGDGQTPLYYACVFCPNLEIIKLLLEQGSWSDNDKNRSLLHLKFDSILPDLIDYIELLVSHGANVNYIEDKTILMRCSMDSSYDTKIIRYLYSIGAELDIVNINRYTALDFSILYGNNDAVQVLIDLGANIPKYILMQTIENGIPENYKLIRLLINSGVDINFQDARGNTVSHILLDISSRNIQYFKMFVTIVDIGKPDFSIKNNRGLTVLDLYKKIFGEIYNFGNTYCAI